jgi:hypothetical protein
VSTDKTKSTIAEAVAAASQQLIAALREGHTEVLKRYLEAMGRFRKYSFTNCMLIFCQKPDATRVAGFHTWKSLGRYVKKGEKGVMIMAPMICTKRAKSEGRVVSIDAEPETYITFRPVYVFDRLSRDLRPARVRPVSRTPLYTGSRPLSQTKWSDRIRSFIHSVDGRFPFE